MTRRPLVAIVACAAVLLLAVTALSVFVLRADARERVARGRAELEADVRLALWRMDSAAQVMLAREAADGASPLVTARLMVTRSGAADGLAFADLDAALPAAGAHVVAAGGRSWDVRNANEYNARLDNAVAASGPISPLWLDGKLVLARRAGDGFLVARVDWPALAGELTNDVVDLLPHAALRPADAGSPSDRRLASLPVALDPGAPPAVPPRSREVAIVVAMAWISALLALAAVAALAVGILRLSERRAAFVSAVTHELRTPLTSLRTHAEMIEDPRVDDDRRRAYAGTLVAEADRLRHLVDNVLAFSQIERGRRGLRADVLEARTVVDRAAPRLRERVAAAGMILELDVPDDLRLVGDGIAVEQVLENLVDNACKYGATPVIVRAGHDGAGTAELSVIDAGPGVAEGEREEVFTAFHKSSSRAAATAPGVGLGLALCRRLARAMNGELVLSSASGRTTFTLRLPAA